MCVCVCAVQSSDKNGNAKIDAFVDEALALYKAQQSTKIDHARYVCVGVRVCPCVLYTFHLLSYVRTSYSHRTAA